jgi:hypothetical protein
MPDRSRLRIFRLEILEMLQGVLFVLAGAFLFGLTVFLFREEIPRERWFRGPAN